MRHTADRIAQAAVTEKSEVRTYTNLRFVCGKGEAPAPVARQTADNPTLTPWGACSSEAGTGFSLIGRGC